MAKIIFLFVILFCSKLECTSYCNFTDVDFYSRDEGGVYHLVLLSSYIEATISCNITNPPSSNTTITFLMHNATFTQRLAHEATFINGDLVFNVTLILNERIHFHHHHDDHGDDDDDDDEDENHSLTSEEDYEKYEWVEKTLLSFQYSQDDIVLVSGKIKKIPHRIQEWFHDGLVDNKTGNYSNHVHFLCTKDVTFYLEDRIENGKLKARLRILDKIFGESAFTFYNIDNTTIQNATIQETILTTEGMFFLIDQKVYFSTDRKFHQVHGLPPIKELHYKAQCHIRSYLDEYFEVIIVLTYEQTKPAYFKHRYGHWTLLDVYSTLGNATIHSIAFHPDRRNHVVLTSLGNESSIHVYHENGVLWCPPWNLLGYDDIVEVKYDDVGQIAIVSKSGREYMSINGGCHFYSLIPPLSLYTHLIFISRNLLKVLRKPIVNEPLDQIAVWFLNGVLLDDHKITNGYISMKYYLQKSLPVSQTHITSNPIGIQHINGTEYSLNIPNQHFSWSDQITGMTITCLPFKLSCVITTKLNATHILGDCLTFIEDIHDGEDDGDDDNQMCERYLWFLNEQYSIKEYQCVNITLDATAQTILIQNSSMIDSIEQGTVFTSTHPFEIITSEKPAVNGIASIKELSGNVESGDYNVCFTTKYFSIFDLLFASDDHCPISFSVQGFNSPTIYLEAWEKIEFSVSMVVEPGYIFPEALLDSAVTVYINPHQVDVRTVREHTMRSVTKSIYIQQKWAYPVYSTITAILNLIHPNCDAFVYNSHLLSYCPPTKFLAFKYPDWITAEQLKNVDLTDSTGVRRVFILPVNYQPPSAQGKALPNTIHVYHADPGQPLYKPRYSESMVDPVWKKCKDTKGRAFCHCTKEMETSTKISESDCIIHVYRILFTERLSPDLYISRDAVLTPLEYAYNVTELNNRVDFILENSFDFMGQVGMSRARKSKIMFRGSGLFHFRFAVILQNVSFCNLATEVIVYCNEEPLPEVVENLIRTTTAIVFGGSILLIFCYQYYTF